jgi:hypothetical protein
MLQNETEYLRELVKDMSYTQDRTRINRESKTTVTIPAHWLGMLIDEGMREIGEIEDKIKNI